MVTDEPRLDARTCTDRVRKIQQLLYGQTLGNKYRAEARRLMDQSIAHFKATARDTYRAVLDVTFEDHTLAHLALARLARTRPHSAMIFLALDSAAYRLVNPALDPQHELLVSDISRTHDEPSAMVMRCLEWISTT